MNVKETPMAVGLDLHAPDTKVSHEGEQVEEVQADAHTCTYYRALIGSLLYASVWLRYDITFAVNLLAHFMTKPTPKAIKAVHRVFAYLKGTPRNELAYAYTDSSDADDKLRFKTTGGHVTLFNGTPVSWHSSLLKVVTLSSCESEYVQA
eukprot:2846053-Rhodomonas_salina.1